MKKLYGVVGEHKHWNKVYKYLVKNVNLLSTAILPLSDYLEVPAAV